MVLVTDNVAFFNGTSGFGTATLMNANRMPTVNEQSSVVKLKIRYMNGQRILFAYLNDSCIGIRNINFWNPSGQFIGIGARTGGNRDLHFVTGMRVLYP